MKRSFVFTMIVVTVAPVPLAGQTGSFDDVSDALRNRIEAGLATGRIVAAGDRVLAMGALPRFYEARGFRTAWFAGPRPLPRVRALLEELRAAREEGLDPDDYHLAALDSLLRVGAGGDDDDLRRRVDAELLLTDAFLVYASHLLQGRVNPESMEPEWVANRREAEFADVLAEALGGGGISRTLASLRPADPEYGALKDALARLRRVAARGGWPDVADGPILRPGDRDPRVPLLRRRLEASGDFDPVSGIGEEGGEAVEENLYGPALEPAVRRFQDRHGLEPDGVVGSGTLSALNVPVEERIRQIETNLERWRWLPEDLGSRHIRVNIAGFDVQVREGGEIALRMRAIVGRAYRQTPVFTGRMTYLVLSPYWHIPPGIAINDKLPLVEEDPGYLSRERITLLDVATNQPVDPAAVEWSDVTRQNFNRRFRLRQDPGPRNALGRVKFMFPNHHNVYLHDTPGRELFARAERSFSSGCIRVEKPLELAEYLLGGDPSWTPERMTRVIERGVETSVVLPEAVPVHMLYWTAWVEPDGTLQLRRDLYDRDGRVRAALTADPPGP